jgi:hypothetical protein
MRLAIWLALKTFRPKLLQQLDPFIRPGHRFPLYVRISISVPDSESISGASVALLAYIDSG